MKIKKASIYYPKSKKHSLYPNKIALSVNRYIPYLLPGLFMFLGIRSGNDSKLSWHNKRDCSDFHIFNGSRVEADVSAKRDSHIKGELGWKAKRSISP